MICEAMPDTRVRNVVCGYELFVVILGVKVEITRTSCHLGGSRPWFICPTCGRRCAILYPVSCRKCLRLYYTSEHRSVADRLLRKAIKHRKRFGQSKGGIVGPFPPQTTPNALAYLFACEAQEMESQIARLCARQYGWV